MSREVNWSLRNSEDGPVWTCKTHPAVSYYKHNIDLSFTVEAGRTWAAVNRNAVLVVRKRPEGKKVASQVLLRVEFVTSYVAKDIIDALIFTARVLHRDDPNVEEWFLNELKSYSGAPIPKPSVPGRGSPMGHPV